jgi:two-component system phosphate regulon sensor histidine kinase PhoR
VRSAFANLVFNAVHYTPEGGKIALLWCADDDGARFTVADTGVGIEAKHIPRLTERFYRVDVARSRESGGTGLGLAIVKHVLSRHEAALHIHSEPGRGSTFTCRFPETRIRRAALDAAHAVPS